MDCETKNNLFQWDVNVYISVPSGIRYVDYNTDPVIRVAVYDGRARIPDELLESPGTLLMWFCVDDRTRMLHKINVSPRPVPPTHATTPAETITFATLVIRLNELLESAGEDVTTLIEETKRKLNTFTSEKSREIDTFKNEAGAKINENLQKANTAISNSEKAVTDAEEAKRNADQAAASANTAATGATQAKTRADQAAQAATTAAAGATSAAGEARNAADQAEHVNITSQQTSSGAVVTTTDKNGQQTSVVIKDGKPGDPGEPGHEIYIENPYDDSALRNQLSTQKENIVELEQTKLTKPASFEVGKYFRIASIDELGNPVLEAVDLPLDDYVKNTDYATQDKGGVFKTVSTYNSNISTSGYLCSTVNTLEQYNSRDNQAFISKGTLENIKENIVKEATGGEWKKASVTIEEEGIRTYNFIVEKQINEIHVRVYSPVLVGYTNNGWYPAILGKNGELLAQNYFYINASWSNVNNERYGYFHIKNEFGGLLYDFTSGVTTNMTYGSVYKVPSDVFTIGDDDFFGVSIRCSSASRFMVGTKFDILWR